MGGSPTQADEVSDSATLYRPVRRLTAYAPRAAPTICWEDGTPVTCEEDRHRKWREYSSELFLGDIVKADRGQHGPFACAGAREAEGNNVVPNYAGSPYQAKAEWDRAARQLGHRGADAVCTWASPEDVQGATYLAGQAEQSPGA